jgi:hypothetical protein
LPITTAFLKGAEGSGVAARLPVDRFLRTCCLGLGVSGAGNIAREVVRVQLLPRRFEIVQSDIGNL